MRSFYNWIMAGGVILLTVLIFELIVILLKHPAGDTSGIKSILIAVAFVIVMLVIISRLRKREK